MPGKKSSNGAMDAAGFRRRLLGWFRNHQRKLPWRGQRDPYRILVSEIMLQQTRVAVVEERYKRFLAQFPTVERLAQAGEQAVLAAWSGLGYYRRARNLHAAAREIARSGEFPRAAEALRQLPGIGRYTAHAVASIAFAEPVAVVDGNVKRVLERVFAGSFSSAQSGKEEIYWEFAGRLLDARHPGDFNQAMMELGALVCLPSQPLCLACPVAKLCAARGPVAKGPRQQRRKAVVEYALARRNGSVFLQQRPQDSSLMPGMWELPPFSGAPEAGARPLLKLRHSITTTDYTVLVFAHAGGGSPGEKGRWVRLDSIDRVALTGLARKILERITDA